MKTLVLTVSLCLMSINCGQKTNENSIEKMKMVALPKKQRIMSVYYMPLHAMTYGAVTFDNIKENATIHLDFDEKHSCYNAILKLIDVKNYKSNYGVFGPDFIRIRIDIACDSNDIYLIDMGGVIKKNNGRSFELTTIKVLDSTINSCYFNRYSQ